jgi:hypothetical protein
MGIEWSEWRVLTLDFNSNGVQQIHIKITTTGKLFRNIHNTDNKL